MKLVAVGASLAALPGSVLLGMKPSLAAVGNRLWLVDGWLLTDADLMALGLHDR